MVYWPNFFIIGLPRAGTTSLYNYLKEIPGIYMSPVKEPHYFSHDAVDFIVNPNAFRLTNEKTYLDLFKGVTNEIAIGEASTTYLKHTSTPQRIYEKIPKAKIIIILRDPVDQFISGYYFRFNSGKTKNSLSNAIKGRCNEVQRRLQKTNSLSIQVKRYLDTFGKDNVKIIIFEEFIQNTKKTVEEVIKFLGITRPSADFNDKVYNSSKKDSQILTQEDKEKLIEFFNEEVIQLKLILDRDLPWHHFQNKHDKNTFFSGLGQLKKEEEDILEKNMIWIFGSPRSGTTWLRKLMSGNPENIIWNEPYLGVHFTIKKNHQDRADYVFSEYYKQRWLPDLRKFILSCTYSHSRKINKKIIIKEPNGNSGSSLLLECLPNSKIIFLLRDGRDVVDSLIDAHNPNSWNVQFRSIPLTNQKIRDEQIKVHSEMWNKTTKIVFDAYKKHNPNLRYLLKYEELKNNTFDQLKKIYEFIGENINDKDLNDIIERYDFDNIFPEEKGTGKFYRSATPGAWKKNFSRSEQQLMNSIMGDTLAQFDYKI